MDRRMEILELVKKKWLFTLYSMIICANTDFFQALPEALLYSVRNPLSHSPSYRSNIHH